MLAAGQPDWPVGRIAEGLAGNRDAVDPCLELAWDAKVIHRCADNEDVGGKKLVEHVATTVVRDPHCTLRCIRWPDGWEALAVKVRDRIGVKVTPDHFETWDCRFQRGDQRCRELARSRISARDAGVDMEEFHGLRPWSALVRTPKSGRYLHKNVSGDGWTPAWIAFAELRMPFVVSSVRKRSIATSSIITSAAATPPADHALRSVRAAA